MPTRLIREGIIDSDAVNALSAPAEVFYRRLMSVVDDFGRFDGRPSVLRSRLYPLRVSEVREADISRWIAECEKAGLIALYVATGKPYILFFKLGALQRAKSSKWPPPPDGICEHMRAGVNGCAHAQASVPGSGSGSGAHTGSGSCERQPPAAREFTKPTAAEVQDFASSEGLAIDAQAFVDFYASKGWMVGKNPMKDWKSAARGWARRNKRQGTGKPSLGEEFREGMEAFLAGGQK